MVASTITCLQDLSFCEIPTNSYTIPILTVTDNCSATLEIDYQISGVTNRNGTGNDASGIFNVGTSTISWTVTDDCGNSSNCSTVITIEDRVTPTFQQLGPYCIGAVPEELPLTSLNTITGTWNPAIITTTNAGSTVYTFTPTTGLCATATQMTIVVNTLPVVTINSPVACEGTDAILTATPESAGDYTFTWTVPATATDPG
ncbi:MAG: hypothetical protein RBU28_07595, partial [Bacteroidales bacterium]|nr:hypothetical protein [Bacteroidales bacterium]